MIKPIQNINFKQAIKNKDVIKTIINNDIKLNELREAKMNATYQFINGKLEMVKSEATDEYLDKKEKYNNWLNEDIRQNVKSN